VFSIRAMRPLSKSGVFAMPAKSPLLPLYETPEEHLDEAELNSITLPIPYSPALATVIIDKLDSPPPHYNSLHYYSPLLSTGPHDWTRDLYCKHVRGNLPNRTAYGAVNSPSPLRPPPRCFSYKLEKQEIICSPWYTSHPEARKQRTRKQLRKDFTDSEFSESQKLSPLLCLLGSLTVMLLLFLWFLSGGDVHQHHHKERLIDE